MNAENIAVVCHEANRAYCKTLGDLSQVGWDEAPEWQRKSAIEGVKFILDNPGAPASANHNSWLASKLADGWQYGPEKNVELKTHPCCVSYDELPASQRLKDYLFRHVVIALSTKENPNE